METPASPTRGEILRTMDLYSSCCSSTLILWPDAIRCWTSGFFAMSVGFVVWPSTNPMRDLILSVSAGSPPSTRILVFGFCFSMIPPRYTFRMKREHGPILWFLACSAPLLPQYFPDEESCRAHPLLAWAAGSENLFQRRCEGACRPNRLRGFNSHIIAACPAAHGSLRQI